MNLFELTNNYQTNHFVSCDLRDTCSSDNKDATFCKTLFSCDYEFERHKI